MGKTAGRCRANHTMEPIEPPWQAIKEWIPNSGPDLNWFDQARTSPEPEPAPFDQGPAW